MRSAATTPAARVMRSLTTLVILGAAVPATVHARLNSEELRIAAVIERGRPVALGLLERIVNVNSGTMNFPGVREVGAILTPELEALGFQVRWVDGAAFGRSGHLVARREARVPGALRVVLIGHLDTVFEPDSPFQRWEALGDTAARGPGAIDMKGGDVVMLLALRGLAAVKALDRLTIAIVLMGDEENVGSPMGLARQHLLEAGEGADVAIGFEDGAGDPRTAVISRRSSTSWMLRTHGRPAHSSQIFQKEVGAGAVFEAGRILEAFRDSLAGEPLLTFNPGAIVGGTDVTLDRAANRGTAFGKNNVVAESTLVTGDLRALTLAQRDRAMATMRRIVERHLPHTGATIEFDEGYPPLAPTDANRRLLGWYDAASRDVGAGPVTAVDPARAGAADVSFLEGRVAMAIDGVGLMGSGGHTAKETADLRTLVSQAKRAAVLLARLPALLSTAPR